MIDTKRKGSFLAFGFKILSDIPLPELPQTIVHKDKFDIEVKIDDLSYLWNEYGVPGKFIVKDDFVLFQIKNTATFCIQEGERIIVSPFFEGEIDKIRLFVLGTCFGVILMQKKILPLHGSAIVIDQKAYAIVGESGAGKSTLASTLLSRGYKLLSDDVIPVTINKDGVPFVIPSYPQQKLWKDSIRMFGMNSTDFRPLFERETKYAIPVESQFCTTPFPLVGVIELVKTVNDKSEVRQINNLEGLHTLFSHTYRNLLISRLGLTEWHFHYLVSFIYKIKMIQIQRPAHINTTNYLADVIINTFTQEEE
jgi:hypothetical protein